MMLNHNSVWLRAPNRALSRGAGSSQSEERGSAADDQTAPGKVSMPA